MELTSKIFREPGQEAVPSSLLIHVESQSALAGTFPEFKVSEVISVIRFDSALAAQLFRFLAKGSSSRISWQRNDLTSKIGL